MQHKVNQETYARVFASLLHGPGSCYELAEETGMHLTTMQSLMNCLKKHKVVHVVAWEKDGRGRDTTPVFAFGRGRDKPRAKMTSAERTAKCRARKKQEPDALVYLTKCCENRASAA